MEVRARDGRIATLGDARVAGLFEQVLCVPAFDEDRTPIVPSIPLQFLAYLVAVFKSTDVDQP